jgi:hypothetical protein
MKNLPPDLGRVDGHCVICYRKEEKPRYQVVDGEWVPVPCECDDSTVQTTG